MGWDKQEHLGALSCSDASLEFCSLLVYNSSNVLRGDKIIFKRNFDPIPRRFGGCDTLSAHCCNPQMNPLPPASLFSSCIKLTARRSLKSSSPDVFLLVYAIRGNCPQAILWRKGWFLILNFKPVFFFTFVTFPLHPNNVLKSFIVVA